MSGIIKKNQRKCQKILRLHFPALIGIRVQILNISVVMRQATEFKTRENVLIFTFYIMTQSKRFVNSETEKMMKKVEKEKPKWVTLFGEEKRQAVDKACRPRIQSFSGRSTDVTDITDLT